MLIIEACTGYNASKHRRPADFCSSLEDLVDPDLEPAVNPFGRYVQWQQGNRAAAGDVPFSLDGVNDSSCDLRYGLMSGFEQPDGRK